MTCEAPFPVWAMLTFAAVTFAVGFEAGRAYTWLHQLWLDRRAKP